MEGKENKFSSSPAEFLQSKSEGKKENKVLFAVADTRELKKRIRQDLISALKEKPSAKAKSGAGKELEVSVLRQLSAAVLNKEKEKRYKISKEKSELSGGELEKESQLTDEEITEVMFSEAKKRKESIVEFSAYAKGYGGPAVAPEIGAEAGKKEKIESFINKEKQELEILQKYLPEQLSEEEIKRIAQEAVKKVGAQEIKDMGKVMAELMPKIKGKADGVLVSKIVKEILVG